MTKYDVPPPEWPHVGDRDVTPRGDYSLPQPIPLDAATIMWPIDSGNLPNRRRARGRLKVEATSVNMKNVGAASGPKAKPPKP
jgi:hypothetical protein